MIPSFVGFIIILRWSSILTLLPIIPTTFFEIPEDTVALINIISGRYAMASWKQVQKKKNEKKSSLYDMFPKLLKLKVMALFALWVNRWTDG